MAIPFENSVPIWTVGAVLVAFCGMVFLTKRSLRALMVFVGVVLFTLLLVAVEWWVVTEREEVELALAKMLAAVEANETQAAVALVDPTAVNLRADVELLMPMVEVSDTGASVVNIEVDSSAEPHEATSRFRGKLHGVHGKSGMQVFYFDDVEMHWVKRGEQWLLESFTAYRKGKPLGAVESLRGNRPMPVER